MRISVCCAGMPRGESAPIWTSWVPVLFRNPIKVRARHRQMCSAQQDAVCTADKVSGVELKTPVLSNALRQPFSTTGLLSNLMSKCAAKAKELESVAGGLDTLLKNSPQYKGLFLIKCAHVCRGSIPMSAAMVRTCVRPPQRAQCNTQRAWCRETQDALDVWTDLRRNVSTPSTFPDPEILQNVASSNHMKRKRRTSSCGDADGGRAAPRGEEADAGARPPAAALRAEGEPGGGEEHAEDDGDEQSDSEATKRSRLDEAAAAAVDALAVVSACVQPCGLVAADKARSPAASALLPAGGSPPCTDDASDAPVVCSDAPSPSDTLPV
jgi:hypothetical protein